MIENGRSCIPSASPIGDNGRNILAISAVESSGLETTLLIAHRDINVDALQDTNFGIRRFL